MSLFCCPVCGGPLRREEQVLRCPKRHSYDLSREGYVYLLPPNQRHSSAPGDDKGMAAARRDFLSKGEGYYTAGIYQALMSQGRHPRMAGTDISKFSLRIAAKREHSIEFAVASSYHLPLADQSVDALLNCFSPLALEEFHRLLRPGGSFLYVVPGANHLWELKQVLYDHPYPNEERETPYDGFTYQTIVPVDGVITLERQSDIHALFQLTPYYWTTPKA